MNNLTKALNAIKNYCSKNPTLPVLANVKLEANNEALELTTTNLEAMATTTIPYMRNGFATTTNLKKLMAATKGMSDPIAFEVRTTQDKNWKGEEITVETLVVSDEDTKVTLNTLPVSDFPLTPPKGQHLGTLDLSGIDRVWPFTASDSSRPTLECVLFELGENAKFVAADGFKLATLTKDFHTDTPASLLIPANSLKKLKRKNMEASVSVTSFTNGKTNHIRFRMNNFALTIVLLDHTYPDWRQIVPKYHDCSFEANVKEWLAALKVASLFAKETNGIVMHTVLEALTVSAKDEDGNRIERVIPILEREGDIPPFALGLKHIETTLKACRNPTVKVKSQVRRDEDGQLLPITSPLVFEDDTNFQAVVMPMNAQGGY